MSLATHNATSNTPAKAVIKHGRERGSMSDTNEQTSPDHASPRMKSARKRKEEPVISPVDDNDTDNVTAVNNSVMAAAPSGRGEVGGPMVAAAADAPLTSCMNASMAVAPAPAVSQLDASVHMRPHDPEAEPDSVSNQQEEHEHPKRGRGRPKGSRTKPRMEGSVSVVSPSDTPGLDVDLLMSGTDSVKRGRGRPKVTHRHGAAPGGTDAPLLEQGSKNKPKAAPVGSGVGDAEDEHENEASSAESEDEDPNLVSSPEDPNKKQRGRPRVGRPAAAEGGGANEAANSLEFSEPAKKRPRGRPSKTKDTESGGEQVPEGSTVEEAVEEAVPTASFVAQAYSGDRKEQQVVGCSEGVGAASSEPQPQGAV